MFFSLQDLSGDEAGHLQAAGALPSILKIICNIILTSGRLRTSERGVSCYEGLMSERMYTDLSPWWPLLSPPEEYEEEAAIYLKLLLEHTPRPRTLLELGSGGGHNASHLKRAFDAVTLVDRAPGMLAVSRALNPELVHVQADLRDVRLGTVFDAVFIHDAISHMITRDDLRRAFSTASQHTKPGGIVLIAPDETKERFAPGTSSGGSDEPTTRRGIRFLEWSHDPDPDDEQISVDYVYLIREADGSVHSVHDRHTGGLFARQVWLDLLDEAGFDARSEVFEHSELERGYELFVGMRR